MRYLSQAITKAEKLSELSWKFKTTIGSSVAKLVGAQIIKDWNV